MIAWQNFVATILSSFAIRLLELSARLYKTSGKFWTSWVDSLADNAIVIDETFPKELGFAVKGFCDSHLLSYLQAALMECSIQHTFYESDTNFTPKSKHCRDHHTLHTLLLSMRERVSALIGTKVAPVYANCKLYDKGSFLSPHQDIDILEYTVSICIMPSTPLVVVNPHTSIVHKVLLQPGDAFIFKGTHVYHARPTTRDAPFLQVFLHYISEASINDSNRDKIFSYAPANRNSFGQSV